MDQNLKSANEALEIAKGWRSGRGRRWSTPSGAEIRNLRLSLGLTQEEFATTYGLDLHSVQSWEQNRKTPEQPNCMILQMISCNPEAVADLVSIARQSFESAD